MPAAIEDDLFQSSTMTFGEHLEELRGCLIRAAAGLAVGVLLGLVACQAGGAADRGAAPAGPGRLLLASGPSRRPPGWTGPPLPYSEAEIRDAIENRGLSFELREVHPERLARMLGPTPAGDTAERPRPARSPTAGRRPAGSPSGLFDADELVPIMLWQPLARDARVSITTLSAQEAFGIYIKAAILVGIVLASPWIF